MLKLTVARLRFTGLQGHRSEEIEEKRHDVGDFQMPVSVQVALEPQGRHRVGLEKTGRSEMPGEPGTSPKPGVG